MKNTIATLSLAVWLAVSIAGPAEAQGRMGGKPRGEVTVDWSKIPSRIAWFGTLETARAAAKATGRPILLVAGAPHCRAVPGVW